MRTLVAPITVFCELEMMMMRLRAVSLLLLAAVLSTEANAQTFTGSLRTRLESWQWFEPAAGDNTYAYAGALARVAAFGQAGTVGWRVELAAPFLLGLPDDAVAPAPGGQLGAGASYWQANDSSGNVAGLFLKQAFLRLGKPVAQGGHSLRAGRFEFVDGAEVMSPNATLASMKRDRVAHRLIGNFGWSHVQRSFDGVQYSYDRAGSNRTVVAVRPTRGVFDANGWGELDVALLYASASRATQNSDWRIFASTYDDYRDPAPVKSDNRAAAVRAADAGDVVVHTLGGHYLRSVPSSAGNLDFMVWAAAQLGDWGALDHRAFGLTVEAGLQPDIESLKPWLRASYTKTSGDGDAADGRHETFFQVLPTPRLYARFPFYNLMNLEDAALSLIVRPGARLTLRAEAHSLRLSESADLWYAGGGAFESETFGYAGRPANGASDLATLFDLSADLRVTDNVSVNAYGAWARGGAVAERIYGDADARLFYLELELRK